MNSNIPTYSSIALFESGLTKEGNRWFALLPFYCGWETPAGSKGALIEVTWKGRSIVYVTGLWGLTESLRLAAFYASKGESLLTAFRHGCRNIYLSRA
jgi:hypothetical protein